MLLSLSLSLSLFFSQYNRSLSLSLSFFLSLPRSQRVMDFHGAYRVGREHTEILHMPEGGNVWSVALQTLVYISISPCHCSRANVGVGVGVEVIFICCCRHSGPDKRNQGLLGRGLLTAGPRPHMTSA